MALPPGVRRLLRLERDAAHEVDDEMQMHIELRVQQLMGEGWNRTDAEAEARRRLAANDEVLQVLYATARERNEHMAMMERLASWLKDWKYAYRALSRRKRLTVLAVLTFGVGVGGTTAMSTVLNAVLLKPLPFPDSEQIVSVYTRNPELRGHATMGEFAERGYLSKPEFEALRERSKGLLTGLALLSQGGGVMTEGDEPEMIRTGITTPDLFARVLRVQPITGRLFGEEDARTSSAVLLLTESFWVRRFGADPDIAGRTIRMGGMAFTVLGVLPQSATLPGYDVDAWFLARDDESWGNHWLIAIARLAPGLTAAQVSARLDPVLQDVVPAGHDRHGVNLFPRHADETRTVRGALWLLGVASLLLLLVACGNVAALLVGAALDREPELAVRSALGAARGHLVRQLLMESVILGLGAILLGLALAQLATRGLILLAPSGVPRIGEADLDVGVFAFAIGVTLVCSIVFGLIPALSFSRVDLRAAMSNSTRSVAGGRARIQGTVVMGEVALATVVLIGAGLLSRTLLALNTTDPGFDAGHSITARFFTPSGLYRGAAGDQARFERVDAYYRDALEKLRALPGVRGVALTSVVPLTGDRNNNDVKVEGRDDGFVAERRFVSPDYFDVLRIRIVAGRGFTAEDDHPDGPGVTIISEGLARAAFPGQSAVGKRLTYWGSRETRIVGVAADVRDESLHESTAMAYYVPRRQARELYGTFILNTSADPALLLTPIRQTIRSIDKTIPIASIQPMSELLREQTASQRYRARLIGVFALLAGVLSLLGLYGITARNVAARTRELGLRLALGARPDGVSAMVIIQALKLCSAGIVIGIAIAVFATRAISAYPYGVKPLDPITYVAIPLLLAAGSVVAALPPSLRAARVQPMETLRAE
jgi:putative ABC transport system permease protein